MKETSGNQRAEELTWVDRCVDTTADNLTAAARPAMNAMIENTATINPFRIPLIQAKIMIIAKNASISISQR